MDWVTITFNNKEWWNRIQLALSLVWVRKYCTKKQKSNYFKK